MLLPIFIWIFFHIVIEFHSTGSFSFDKKTERRKTKFKKTKRKQSRDIEEALGKDFLVFPYFLSQPLLMEAGFTGFVPGFTGFYWVLQGFTEFHEVLLGFTGFDWILLDLTGFYWVVVVHSEL